MEKRENNSNTKKVPFREFKGVILFLLLFTVTSAFAQQERSAIQRGNRAFERGNFIEAETEFREALLRNQKSPSARFNLGNALFMQQKFDRAREQFEIVAIAEEDEMMRARAFHNIGNTFAYEHNFAQAIDAYRRALKLNPRDEDTRYNLALANALLQQQQSQCQQQQNDDNQDDNRNQEEQQQNQNQNQQQQEQDNNMSRENAEQILDAFDHDERELIRRLNEQKTPPQNRRNFERNW